VGSAASIVCETHAIHEGGDHWIVIGRVVAVDRLETDLRPLLFYRGQYVGLEEG
jgi:3-hydroxy-9,10-secoandrosta-1,3,5(10)-triene-9,17-dione monooxygenase reductase component